MNGRGLEGFVGDLEARGIPVTREAGVVSWPVVVAAGQLAGTEIHVGVAEAELQRWPATVPHWIHLPSDLKFARTNPRGSSRSGWTKHSRNCQGWGHSPKPVRVLLAHIQAVVGDAYV